MRTFSLSVSEQGCKWTRYGQTVKVRSYSKHTWSPHVFLHTCNYIFTHEISFLSSYYSERLHILNPSITDAAYFSVGNIYAFLNICISTNSKCVSIFWRHDNNRGKPCCRGLSGPDVSEGSDRGYPAHLSCREQLPSSQRSSKGPTVAGTPLNATPRSAGGTQCDSRKDGGKCDARKEQLGDRERGGRVRLSPS